MSDDRNFITLSCPDRELEVRLRLGPAGAKLTGGVGGTTTATLPRDTDAVLWESHPPYGQTVDLLLDGHQILRPVSGDLHALYVMARARPGEARPPTVRLDGNARRTDLNWLIVDIDTDEAKALARDSDGALTRLPVTLVLQQDSRPEMAIVESPAKRHKRKKKAGGKGKPGGGSGATYTVQPGDTLGGIAAKKNVKGGVNALKKLNGIRDPNRIRAGQTIRLP